MNTMRNPGDAYNFAFAKNIFVFANFKYAFAKINFAKAEK